MLDFDKIVQKLADSCLTAEGIRLASTLQPSQDDGTVSERLDETEEFFKALQKDPHSPIQPLQELREAIRAAQAGAMLPAGTLWQLSEMIRVGEAAKQYCERLGPGFPRMSRIADGLHPLAELRERLQRSVNRDGDVLDSASDALTKLRIGKRNLAAKLRDRLDSMVRSELAKYLQEPIVTIRGGRYVLPVKQEYRQMVPGLVHDQSGSGATLFIEPLAVIELGNEIRRLESMEKEEVEKILFELSRLVGTYSDELTDTLEAIGRLDFGFAKARLAMEMAATKPVLEPGGSIWLKGARHPLLGPGVVPIDIELGKRFTTLIITGPNTGGKTVTLKTVGLLTLMAQAGLFIPAAHGSRIGVFRDVLCDIGDEQSIEQNLSTFSGHMSNIVTIIQQLEEGEAERKLVLLDELGAGTDPTEGAALGMAVLDHLVAMGARVLVTTHYSELKLYAYKRDNVENASVEFDVQTLKPTYRIVIGIPGRSNALEISARLGLRESIIEKAKEYLSGGYRDFETVIGELVRSKADAERESEEAAKLKERARRHEEQARKELEEIKAKKRALLDAARQEVADVLKMARERAEEIERLAKKAREVGQADESLVSSARGALDVSREALARVEAQATQLETAENVRPVDAVRPGMSVYVPKMKSDGIVISVEGNGQIAEVQVGSMRIRLSRDELRMPMPSQPDKENRRLQIWRMAREKARTVGSSLDVRGKTVAEALADVDKYLDDAVLAGQSVVTIVHGKGTGALRSAIAEFLRLHPQVSSSRTGTLEEGGEGVTVAQLKSY